VIGITAWSLSELISNPEHIKYFSFKCWHFNKCLSDIQKISAGSLSDLLAIRDRQLCLPTLFFSSQQLGDIIDYLCTSWLIYAPFWSCVHFFAMYVCILLVLDLCTWSTNKYNNNKGWISVLCPYIGTTEPRRSDRKPHRWAVARFENVRYITDTCSVHWQATYGGL